MAANMTESSAGTAHPEPDFPVVTLEPVPFAFIRKTSAMSEISRAMGEGFAELGAKFGAAKAPMAGMPMAHYIAYDTKTTTFELGFPCRAEDEDALRKAGLSIGRTPAGLNMKATHTGPYDTVGATYDAMTKAMKTAGHSPAPDMWETYFSPPDTPPEKIKTEVTWPIAA